MELIAYGKVVKPHGLSGEVKVLPFSGEFSSFKNFINLYISLEKNNPPKFIISRSRNQKNYIIVKLEGIDSIDDAEHLKGLTIFIDKKELPLKEEDEYYWFELIGMNVFNNENILIGKVKDIIDNTAQPVLVIKNNSEEYLVPMVEKFVEDIDLVNSKIVINPIEGLI